MALTVSARARWTRPSTSGLIRSAALCAAVGISLSLTEYGDFGRWLTVAGVVLLLVGLHRFGRMGPDPAILFELPPAPRKKKKKKRAKGSQEPSSEEPSNDTPGGDEPSNDTPSNDTPSNDEPSVAAGTGTGTGTHETEHDTPPGVPMRPSER